MADQKSQQKDQKDLIARLADAGEEAIQRLAKAPGGENVLKAMNSTRERIDELQRKVRGIDELEKRVVALEKKVDALSKAGPRRAVTRRPARTPKAAPTTTPPSTTPPSTTAPSTGMPPGTRAT